MESNLSSCCSLLCRYRFCSCGLFRSLALLQCRDDRCLTSRTQLPFGLRGFRRIRLGLSFGSLPSFSLRRRYRFASRGAHLPPCRRRGRGGCARSSRYARKHCAEISNLGVDSDFLVLEAENGCDDNFVREFRGWHVVVGFRLLTFWHVFDLCQNISRRTRTTILLVSAAVECQITTFGNIHSSAAMPHRRRSLPARNRGGGLFSVLLS